MRHSDPKLCSTTNYALFSYENKNRPLRMNGKKRKNLRRLMEQYGFLPSLPITCVRGKDGKLIVKDGQHRLATAKELGLPVFYVAIERQDVDAPDLNNAAVNWVSADYAGSFAAQGKKDYAELIEFAEQHRLPLATCIGLLGNNAHERNLRDAFNEGRFKVKSRELADRVARLYTRIAEIDKCIKTRFFIGALFAVCLVDGFEDDRFVDGAKRIPEALKRYGSRDGFLDMIEHIYNYGRRIKFPVRIAAENAMRERNPMKKSNDKPKSKAA